MIILERSEYEEVVSALSSQMDQNSLSAAWTEGRAMTMEEAIALA